MKTVTMMSGPAIRKLRGDNARLRLERRRLIRVLEAAERINGILDGTNLQEEWRDEIQALDYAVAAAREIVPFASSSTEPISSLKGS